MPVTLLETRGQDSLPIHTVRSGGEGLPDAFRGWAEANGFKGDAGQVLTLPAADGRLAGALFGIGRDDGPYAGLAAATLARKLPAGTWHFETMPGDADLASLSLLLGGYAFTRYGNHATADIAVEAPGDAARAGRVAEGVFLARDLINTPTNDMLPSALESEVRKLAAAHGAEVSVIAGDELLARNFPMIHAVGRASSDAPRLIDMAWGAPDAPKVTLVGKGVCFDTGGLDIKPPSSMLLMKKDMGGAANVLGLASMIMAAGLKLRLRVVIPAVENAIAGNAFRPGDVLRSRKGITVEIGNTDAEGRLILADALALADEEAPQLMIDMATLTGAARVALGPELPPFFTDDDALAEALSQAGAKVADPLWRLPLWQPYMSKFASRIADTNNVNTDGFAGSIIAALFLKKFVEKAQSWAHFDIFGWNPVEKPHCPVGGEAQAIRAIEQVLSARFG
jgi:leucyl aminopeptidase